MRYSMVLHEWRNHLQTVQNFQNEKRTEINNDLPPQYIEWGYNADWYGEHFEDTAPNTSQNSNPYSAPRFYLADHSKLREPIEFYRLAKKVDQKVREAYSYIIFFSQSHSQFQLWQVVLLQLMNINQFLVQEAMPKLRKLNHKYHAFSLLMLGPEQNPLCNILNSLWNWVRGTMDILAQQLNVPIAIAVDAGIVQTTSTVMGVPIEYQPSTPRLFSPEL